MQYFLTSQSLGGGSHEGSQPVVPRRKLTIVLCSHLCNTTCIIKFVGDTSNLPYQLAGPRLNHSTPHILFRFNIVHKNCGLSRWSKTHTTYDHSGFLAESLCLGRPSTQLLGGMRRMYHFWFSGISGLARRGSTVTCGITCVRINKSASVDVPYGGLVSIGRIDSPDSGRKNISGCLNPGTFSLGRQQ